MTRRAILAALVCMLVPALAVAELGVLERAETIRYEMDEVRELAGKLEDRSRSVRRAAERLDDDSRAGRRALEELFLLEARAAFLTHEMGRFGRDASSTARDFREVQRAYVRAARSLGEVDGWQKVNLEFDRLSDAMFELEMYAVDLLTRLHLTGERELEPALADSSAAAESAASAATQDGWASFDCLNLSENVRLAGSSS